MALDRLDHYSIRTTKLKITRDFYVDVMNLEEGFRPNFEFPGHWLYCGDRAVVHLIGVDPDDTSALTDFLGQKSDEELAGAGAIDHIAFRATDLASLKDRLAAKHINCVERTIPELDLHLVFLDDPNGITIELNYIAAEAG